MSYCPKCGTYVNEGSAFCPQCGTSISATPTPAPQPATVPSARQACPDTHLAFAILTTLFCCLPFGIVAIIKAAGVSSAFQSGNYELAQKNSADAAKWSRVALICGIVFYLLYVLFFVVLGAGAALLD